MSFPRAKAPYFGLKIFFFTVSFWHLLLNRGLHLLVEQAETRTQPVSACKFLLAGFLKFACRGNALRVRCNPRDLRSPIREPASHSRVACGSHLRSNPKVGETVSPNRGERSSLYSLHNTRLMSFRDKAPENDHHKSEHVFSHGRSLLYLVLGL